LPAASKSTRTFSDFESVADAMNGICQLYEQRLKQMNPGKFSCPTPSISGHFLAHPANALQRFGLTRRSGVGVRNITYDITELYGFIDQLGDLCCLVHNGYGAYEPHNKQWVKDRVFAHLKRMAQ